jgi:hypothetical protein
MRVLRESAWFDEGHPQPMLAEELPVRMCTTSHPAGRANGQSRAEQKCVKRTCKPNSVPPLVREGEDHSSAGRVTAPVKQPTRTLERTRASPLRPYLVLLRRGFAVPSTLACDAVRSYRTVSPLPRSEERLAVCFLLHFPSRFRAWPLASLLPVGVRTFLDPASGTAILRSSPHGDSNRGAVREILSRKSLLFK